MNTKSNKRKYGFQVKTLLHLVFFNLVILILLWYCEILIFDIYYKKYQTDNLNSIIETINKADENQIMETLESAAYNNEVCILVLDKNEKYLFNHQMEGCLLATSNQTIIDTIDKFINSDEEAKSFEFINEENHTDAMLYSMKYKSGHIFLYSNLQDISTVTIIIKQQLKYISIIAIIIAILVSIFLSNKITYPISRITKKAKEFAKGNYNVEFESSDILEIDELSQTLTNVKNELSKTDELRRDLMANVSHDLKTPLTMIKAYAEMIKDISHKDKNKMNEHLNIIIDETDRLTILVNDILSLSKLEAGKDQKLEIEEFDLVKEIKKISKKYEIIKDTENYIIKLELPEIAVVKADKNKINQVIYNLVNNAINYTGNDKTVTIKVTSMKKQYLVEVIDTGKGIKKEELPYIWDKYYKSEKKHKRNVISTGLGLSIVKQILLAHKLEYGVSSKENKGSTFYFKINSK